MKWGDSFYFFLNQDMVMRYFDVNLKNESEEKEMINTINTSKPSFGDKPKIKSGIPDNIDWE